MCYLPSHNAPNNQHSLFQLIAPIMFLQTINLVSGNRVSIYALWTVLIKIEQEPSTSTKSMTF